MLNTSQTYCLRQVGTSKELGCLHGALECLIMGHKREGSVYTFVEDVYMVHNNVNSVLITKIIPAHHVDIELGTWLLSEGKPTKEG